MLQNSPMILSDELRYALDQLEHSRNHIFISGRAGTGKSTLLNLFRSTSRKRIAVVAPTGVAALNVRGQTIHSFFKIPPRLLERKDIHKAKNNKLYKNLELLIIDEISMVRADLFDAMDYFLQLNRGIPLPFGGVRIVMFGDLYQLPPVVASRFEKEYLQRKYHTQYFFSSMAYSALKENLETIELNTVYRQNEKYFINLLDSIRTKTIDPDELEDINNRITDEKDKLPGTITLTTRNDIVRKINAMELQKIEWPTISYSAKVNGLFDPRYYPTDLDLKLKKGSQIMLLKNDPLRRYVNGTIGRITEISENSIKVIVYKEDDEIEIEIEKAIWEMIKYSYIESEKQVKAEVIGSFEQWPLRLAWAITIHKSQGKTFNRVYIDMGRGAFEYGQTYVALSRCTSMEGLQLKNAIRMSDIIVDERITDFYNNWR